jgi:hypothetical protein
MSDRTVSHFKIEVNEESMIIGVESKIGGGENIMIGKQFHSMPDKTLAALIEINLNRLIADGLIHVEITERGKMVIDEITRVDFIKDAEDFK